MEAQQVSASQVGNTVLSSGINIYIYIGYTYPKNFSLILVSQAQIQKMRSYGDGCFKERLAFCIVWNHIQAKVMFNNNIKYYLSKFHENNYFVC